MPRDTVSDGTLTMSAIPLDMVAARHGTVPKPAFRLPDVPLLVLKVAGSQLVSQGQFPPEL